MDNKVRKKTRVDVGLSLWQKASVLLSLLSFYTTEQGFQNTVFVGSHPAWPLFASFAVQTILVVGVLFGFPIIRALQGFKKAAVFLIWFCTAAVSITFSYISIVNSMYHMDFAVNGNQVLEIFIRNTVQSLENENRSEMEELRPELVRNLMEHGYEVMEEAVKNRAANYISVTDDYAAFDQASALFEVEKSYFPNGYEYIGDSSGPIRATREYVIARYPENYAKQKDGEFWADHVSDTINGLNEVSYTEYLECCSRINAAIQSYNECRDQVLNGDMPSLERLKSLVSECDVLKSNVDKVIEGTKKYEIKDVPYKDGSGTYNNETANTCVRLAQGKLNALGNTADNLKLTLENFISNSYGDDNKSVDEILALIGNSNADVSELEAARDQMLTAQGSILQNMIREDAAYSTESEGETIEEILEAVNELMSQLDTYVNKAVYMQSISAFKESYLVYIYNIIEETDPEEDESVTDQERQDAETESGLNRVKNVTAEEWTQERKIHMSELAALVFDYPVYTGKSDDGGGSPLEEDSTRSDVSTEYGRNDELEMAVYEKQKLFLDTSESEKAYNLLWGKSEDFQYKGKAVISFLFAIFLDLGAAAVGYIIDVIKYRRKYIKNM